MLTLVVFHLVLALPSLGLWSSTSMIRAATRCAPRRCSGIHPPKSASQRSPAACSNSAPRQEALLVWKGHPKMSCVKSHSVLVRGSTCDNGFRVYAFCVDAPSRGSYPSIRKSLSRRGCAQKTYPRSRLLRSRRSCSGQFLVIFCSQRRLTSPNAFQCFR